MRACEKPYLDLEEEYEIRKSCMYTYIHGERKMGWD